MFGRIFDPDNRFFRTLDRVVDLLILSVFWLACSLPLVTLGPATAALYHTVARCIRGDERNSWGVFFRAFRDDLKVGIPVGLVVLAGGAVLFFLQGLLYQTTVVGRAGEILYAAYLVFLIFPLGFGSYLFPALSRFDMGAGGVLVNCFKLSVVHLPSTIALGLLLYGALMVCAGMFVCITFLPALLALIQSFLLERIFAPYMSGQEE